MMCMNCGAKAEKGFTTSVTDLGNCLVIVRNVPCYKCTECNEITYTGDVLKSLKILFHTLKSLCRKFQLLTTQKSHKQRIIKYEKRRISRFSALFFQITR